jgi:hypothetical protein
MAGSDRVVRRRRRAGGSTAISPCENAMVGRKRSGLLRRSPTAIAKTRSMHREYPHRVERYEAARLTYLHSPTRVTYARSCRFLSWLHRCGSPSGTARNSGVSPARPSPRDRRADHACGKTHPFVTETSHEPHDRHPLPFRSDRDFQHRCIEQCRSLSVNKAAPAARTRTSWPPATWA